MTTDVDLYVDSALDDVIWRWESESDFERAANREECAQSWIHSGPLKHCVRYANALRERRVPLTAQQLRRERQLLGLCQEQHFIRTLCHRPFKRSGVPENRRVYWQVRIVPGNPSSPVVDAVVPNMDDPRKGFVYEHKSIDADFYLQRLHLLQARIESDVQSVRNKIEWSGRAGSLLPRTYRHELVYSVNRAPREPPARAFFHDFIVRTARDMGVTAHVRFR
jgi:hypothetical protein